MATGAHDFVRPPPPSTPHPPPSDFPRGVAQRWRREQSRGASGAAVWRNFSNRGPQAGANGVPRFPPAPTTGTSTQFSPSAAPLTEDLGSAEFRTGVVNGFWNLAGADVLPDGLDWPTRVFWMAAAARVNAPARFYVLLDLSGYKSVPPTGTFWDPTTKSPLEFSKRPKGKTDSRFAKVFRTDWESGSAFYHYYLRAKQFHIDISVPLR